MSSRCNSYTIWFSCRGVFKQGSESSPKLINKFPPLLSASFFHHICRITYILSQMQENGSDLSNKLVSSSSPGRHNMLRLHNDISHMLKMNWEHNYVCISGFIFTKKKLQLFVVRGKAYWCQLCTNPAVWTTHKLQLYKMLMRIKHIFKWRIRKHVTDLRCDPVFFFSAK